MTTLDSADPIDHEALRSRYLAERDKRIRADGNDQYIEPTGTLSHLLDDPWVVPAERDPVDEEVTVAVIGAGFGGLVTGARLVEAGVTDVRLIDGIRDGLRRLRDEHWLAVKTASQLALLKLRIDPLFQKLKPSVILARCRVAEDTTARAHEFRNLWERYKQSFESVSVDLAKMFDDIRRTGETGETGELGQLG